MRRALVFALLYALLASAVVVLNVEPVWTMTIPPALCAVPLIALGTQRIPVARRASLLSLALLSVFILLGLMSIGGLFVPSAIALSVAVSAGREAGGQPPRPAVEHSC